MLSHRLRRYDLFPDKDVDKRLKRLHVFLRKEVVVHGHSTKVHEAGVEFEMAVDVPKRAVPVAMV